MVKRSLSCAGVGPANSIIWACVILMGTGSLWAGESTSLSTAVTHKVYTPTSISAEAAKMHLAKLGLGTVSQLPMTNGLLITGEASAVTKAQAVLKVVDVDRAYEVQLAGPESLLAGLPSRDRIATAIGDIAVGSLDSLPCAEGKAAVIIDRHQGQVLVIAPKDKMERIISLVEGKVVIPSLGQDGLGAGLDKSAKTSVVDVASWTQSHVLGAPQTVPNATAVDAGAKAQGVSASSSEGRITGPGISTPSGLKLSGASVQSNGDVTVTDKPRSSATGASTQVETANQTYPTPAVPNGDQTLALNLPDKLSVEALLGFVGEYLHLDFMYDPAKVQGDVTLKLQGDLRGPIKVKDLYPLLESVLKFKGFVMTRKGNIVTVVPASEAMDADPKLRTRSGPVDFGDAVITRVFRLRHVDPSNAESLLTQMKLGVVGTFSSIPETRTLIVTAFTATMPKIEALLDLVDQPGEPKQFRYRQLKYTMASSLTDKVKALAEQLGTIQVSVSTTVTQPTLARIPGESDAAYNARRQRDAIIRQAQAAARPPTMPGAAIAPESVYLDADERTNRVLMIGRQEQLAIVDKLVDSLDVQQQDLRSLMLYRIEHVEAQDVRKKLEELNIIAAQYTYPSTTRLTGAQRPPTIPGQPTPQPMVQPTESTTGTGTALDAPQVVVVEATNALLVNATAEQHKRIAEILKHVDSETLDSAMPFEIYPLENQGPDRMAEVLDKLLKETIKDKDNKIEQVVRKIEEEITIVPDSNTYSLIVHATPKNQQWIGKLIKTLDKRRPQVLIDVTLVEISKTEDFTYDLQAVTAFPKLANAAGLTGVPNLMNAQTGNVLQSISGNLTGFYGDQHINVLLTAMQKKNYGRVLAKPKILVNDNETGTIKTTDTTYVKTTGSAIPTIVGGTSSGAITTSELFTGYDAGITMDITPHISEGDLLQLKINLIRSDFTNKPVPDKDGVTPPPDKSQSDINTVVTVPDKSTIILGGMIKLNQSKGGTKVPILGDLPIVGAAFRSTGNSDIEKKLYVFVKAEVIRPADVMASSDAMQKLSDRHRMAFEKHEAEFQQEQSIPGIKSKSMSPEKVLDAQ